MKNLTYLSLAIVGLSLSACDDLDNQLYEGNYLTAEQMQETNAQKPERVMATFNSMYSMMGNPNGCLGGSRPDDYGFVMMALSNDLEASDCWIPDLGYNWFSVCGEWSSRNPNYANPYIRYIAPYKQMKLANDVIGAYAEDVITPGSPTYNKEAHMMVAQAHAIRAFDYLSLAFSFQFNYADHKNEPCVPIVTDKTQDAATNPRASVKDVYDLIISDLSYACSALEDYVPEVKSQVSGAVAYGLRARAYLTMEEWELAAKDAQKAMELSGATPASMAQVSTPSFCSMEEANWLWGVDVTQDQANSYPYATCCSWTSSFSGWAYSAGAGCYLHINPILYNKIDNNDVRKGWWLDENLHSPLLSTISWNGVTGDDIAPLIIEDTKEPMDGYTNVKFGMKSGIGSELNNNAWPLMRIEELILIKAEALAKAGQPGEATSVLENFVKTYRCPDYSVASSGRTLENEIWFQRRIELWGEGFGMSDIMRLKKPVVRFHGQATVYPTNFRFNVRYGDKYMLLRFPQTETDNNASIVNNEGGEQPTPGQNAELRDGVTD